MAPQSRISRALMLKTTLALRVSFAAPSRANFSAVSRSSPQPTPHCARSSPRASAHQPLLHMTTVRASEALHFSRAERLALTSAVQLQDAPNLPVAGE